MKLDFPSLPRNTELCREAIQILNEQMGIAKTAIFMSDAFWQPTDYLEIKDKLFADETVASLYAKVVLWREQNQKP